MEYRDTGFNEKQQRIEVLLSVIEVKKKIY